MALAVGTYGRGSSRFRVLRNLEAGDIAVNERLFPTGYRECLHAHERPYFSLILSGEYSERDGRAVQTYRGPCLGFQPVGEHESSVYGEPVHTLVVEFPAALASDQSLTRPFAAGAGPTAMRIYQELSLADRFSGLALQGLVLELIAEAGRALEKHTHIPKWLRRAEELMRLRYAETLTLEEIACEVGVHPVSLARAYRRHHGMTVGEALRRNRVHWAQQMMRLRKHSLAEIAAEMGFADQSHFSRVFRQVTGMSPAVYRDTLS
jgi:AraC family transcriptional regulator